MNTFIFGSCVSRDTFGFLGDDFHLTRYVARQSAISASTDASALLAKLKPIDSPFQQRMVVNDLAGDLPVALESVADEIDVVLVDLIDERGGVIDTGGGRFATKLSEFWSAGGREAVSGMTQYPFGSDQHFALWQEGVDRFVAQLEGLRLKDRTLVLRTPWASKFEDGQVLEVPEWMIHPADADQMYVRYFGHLKAQGLQILELPTDLARTPRNHRWGASPFHYIDAAYEFLADGIKEAFRQPRRPHMERRNTAEWGDFSDFSNVSEIERTAQLPELITLWQGGFPIDLMVEDNGAATTLVSFHAALGGSGLQPPVFTGRAISAGIGVNRVFVSDPSLLSSKDLGLAWYLGTQELDLTDVLTRVLSTLQTKLGAQHLVFFGMSGGGFASLNLSHQFPGSLAVPVNPQTRILDYAPVHWQAMANACLGTRSEDEARRALEAHPRADQRQVYEAGFDNYVIYVQNSADGHVSNQMVPWLEAVGWSERAPVLMRDWGQGHKPPPPTYLREMLSKIAGAEGRWAGLADVWGAEVRPSRQWVRELSGR
ncbi:DUF6270 domain-containing protein [Ornithinimicrobium panacihumi]|uniref:DUF6270 domain-containing protein n=1 Tax=Ornithinimicrobium panacihumi TaxID=2008449 RepID=UPI003F8BF035